MKAMDKGVAKAPIRSTQIGSSDPFVFRTIETSGEIISLDPLLENKKGEQTES